MQNKELLESRENEKQASKKYIELYDFAPSGIFSLSKEGEIIDLNLTGAKILSKDRQYLKGSRFGFFVTDETKPVFNLFLERVIKNRVKESCEVILLSDNDTQLYVQLFGIATKNGEQCLLTLNDITERKLGEQLLLESEIKYRTFFENSIDAIILTGPDGKILSVNQAACNMSGFSEDELIGIGRSGVEDVTDPRLSVLIEERKRNGKARGEVSLLRRDGTHFNAEISSAIFKNHDGQKLTSMIIRDVTKQKNDEQKIQEREKRFRAIFYQAPIAMALIDMQGHPIICNLPFSKMLGYSSDELTKMKFTEFTYPEDIDKDMNQFTDLLAGKISGYNMEKRYIHKNGDLIWANLFVTTLSDDNGKLSEIIAMVEDITDRKNAEEEIRKANEIREQLIAHMTEIRENERALISREIHDQLGQSLTALKLDLNWLEAKMNNTPEIKEKLSGMVNIITLTIKDVQRISSELRPGILDDLGLAAAIEWYAEEFEKRSNLIIKLDLDEVQAPNGQANLALFRVMQESLTNIIRHAKAKSVNISLHEMNEHIVLDIEDDGIGMSVEKLNSIHSLGLLGMHDRIKQVGGTLDILCGSDAGTKIRICISSENILPELSKDKQL